MATMKLADLVQHQEFTNYFRQEMLSKSLLVQSGIAVPDPVIAAKVAAGSGLEGKTLDMPYLESLDSAGDAEVPVDGTNATDDKVGTKNDVAVVQYLRKTFAVTDVAATMGRVDPMAHIVSQLTPYWLKQDQKRFLAIVKGVFAANDAGAADATHDITTLEGTAANLAKDTILMGAQLLGDRSAELTAVAMNSRTAAYLAALDTNAGLYRASEAPGQLATYNGRAILVDDAIEDASGEATIYLFGAGSVVYNELPTPHPFEAERDANAAIDRLHSWRRCILHVRGWKWQGSMAGTGPTVAELEASTAWTRVFDRKRVPLVRVKAKIA